MLNRYAYCRNNPLIYVDPDGHLFAEAAAIGAWMGGLFAAQNDAPIWKGAVIGAATSLITAGAFDVAGGICADLAMQEVLEGVALRVAEVGIHAAAGAVSGGINSTISGGDVGLGMLTGAMSGGFGKFAGHLLPKNEIAQFVGRMAVGGALGGITAEIYGGSFETGFAWGAFTAFMGYQFNDEQEVHELYELAKRVWTGGDMIDSLREFYGEENPHDNPYVNERRPYSERTPVDPETVKVQLEGLCYCMAGGLYMASGYVYTNPELFYFGVGLSMDGSYRLVTGKELLGPVPNP
jgi:hypothetical protein